MKLISHRGLLDGPDQTLENRPDQILTVCNQGFDCEIDLWFVNSQLYLGHDEPQYKISHDFISNNNLWIHAKNLDALHFLSTTTFNYFWHQTDDFTLTSKGFIWTYPGKDLTDASIMVLPEMFDPSLDIIKNSVCYGVCTDYINKIKELYV
jgi:hypothetical protein